MDKLIKKVEGKKIEITQDELIYLFLAVGAKLSVEECVDFSDVQTGLNLLATTLIAIDESPEDATRKEIARSKKAFELSLGKPEERKKRVAKMISEVLQEVFAD